MVKEKNKREFFELADHSNVDTSNINDDTMITARIDTEIELKEITVFNKRSYSRIIKVITILVLVSLASILITFLKYSPEVICPF